MITQLSRTALPAILLALTLGACTTTAMQAVPAGADARTKDLAAIKDSLDQTDPAPKPQPVMAGQAPMITGLGFAQVSGQPGKTQNEKRLMAIRAARMDALRDLTEQVHGIQLSASTSVRNAVVQNDSLNAVVAGTLRGARTLSITPRDGDSYEVKMALDRATVAYILRAMRGTL